MAGISVGERVSELVSVLHTRVLIYSPCTDPRLTFLQDVSGGVSPGEEDRNAPRHELLGVAVAGGAYQHAVAVPIPLPVGNRFDSQGEEEKENPFVWSAKQQARITRRPFCIHLAVKPWRERVGQQKQEPYPPYSFAVASFFVRNSSVDETSSVEV